MLMKKQRYLAGQIHNLSTYTAEERFLRFIASHFGNKKEVEINLSKKDIASAIGIHPETLSRIFASLKRKGILEQEGKKIRLKNP
jgi:CRP/FNR family transcriptional regulator